MPFVTALNRAKSADPITRIMKVGVKVREQMSEILLRTLLQ